MTLLTGINHIAVMTDDIDRFVAFYTEVFDVESIFAETTPTFRHAMLRVGEVGVIHAVEQPHNPHGHGLPDMLDRGHLDHLAFNAPTEAAFDEIRSRLCRYGASDGTVHDLGPQLAIWFTDPDGMSGEVCWNRDPDLVGFHAPVPINFAAPLADRSRPSDRHAPDARAPVALSSNAVQAGRRRARGRVRTGTVASIG